MDTPDKNQISATPLSKFENSPVFNYIDSLSPIEPVKSVHTDHTFNSLTFASPSSLFTSPQISSHRESRFSLRRHQCSDPSRSELPLSGNENNTNEAVSEGVQLSDICAERVECFTPGSSNREVGTTELPNDQLELEIELPTTLKYDSGSPDSNMVPHNLTDTGPGMLGTLASPVESNKDDLKERQYLFERELHLRKICRIQQNEELAGCDWVTLITDVANLLTSNSSITEDNIEGKDEKSVDPGTISFISTVLQLPQDNANDLENMESVDPSGSSKQSEMMGLVTQSGEIGDMNETDQTPAILSSNLLDKLLVSDTSEKVDNVQRRIRRRCLVFEMAGAHKKKSACDSNCSSSTSLPSDCKIAYIEKHLVPSKTGSNYISSTSPGIGLHLNELANTSNDGKVCKGETLASGMQLKSIPGSISSSDSYFSDQNPLNNYLISNSMERNVVLCDSENIVMENAPQTSAGVVGNESDYSSPKKKKHKSEPAGGSEACKRCNCRRSKCLKLYCECFAAGLYCVEPCSCHDCFNKPVHEDIVLETRRQIESRNPIAFAPKVIRSIESVPEFGEETNKTPASARHKRGCNCKKSSCLKKYCECFQGGVGCSFGCRCEGCKNTFGRKDGADDETEFEGEDTEAEKNELEVSSHDNVLMKDEEKHTDLSIIPSEIARPPIQAFTFDGKKLPGSSLHADPSPQLCAGRKIRISELFGHQPRFKAHLQAIPEDETAEVLKSNCSPTSGVKSASPNSKRVSPPHPEIRSSAAWHSSRKLVLRSVPRFPSLNPP